MFLHWCLGIWIWDNWGDSTCWYLGLSLLCGCSGQWGMAEKNRCEPGEKAEEGLQERTKEILSMTRGRILRKLEVWREKGLLQVICKTRIIQTVSKRELFVLNWTPGVGVFSDEFEMWGASVSRLLAGCWWKWKDQNRGQVGYCHSPESVSLVSTGGPM